MAIFLSFSLPGGPAGSYRYMAPEVFRHEPYNSRVDVYSFSMIVYQLFEVRCRHGGAAGGQRSCECLEDGDAGGVVAFWEEGSG